ncbi:MAG: LysR family transcriptional regulator [Cohaesibacter sp.]|jgi:DNA-binding transcriptional LysR family regulator|nr:LysR family transcriptional regulator [Cohaesibacter sp.]
MDILTGMRTFCAVVEERSFVRAAQKLEISAALTSKYVAQLEERLGARLLNRTTRSLALTEEGQAYFERCSQILDQFDEMEAAIKDKQGKPHGRLLVSAPISLGESHLSAAIAQFLQLHEGISIELRLSDRFINIVDEGFDLAIRMGQLGDSSLIARKLAPMYAATVASADYLAQHGEPKHPSELTGHECIHDTNFLGGKLWPYQNEEGEWTIPTSGRFAVNSAQAARAAALANVGIAALPRYIVKKDIDEGRLIEILPDYMRASGAVYALYPHNRHLAMKVRVFVDFMVRYFAEQKDWQ